MISNIKATGTIVTWAKTFLKSVLRCTCEAFMGKASSLSMDFSECACYHAKSPAHLSLNR